MKKILFCLSDTRVSPFDIQIAYDAMKGEDFTIERYEGIKPDDAKDIVEGIEYSRTGNTLVDSALFIGGKDIAWGEEMMKSCIFAIPHEDYKFSITMDTKGACTTSSACVAKIMKKLGSLEGNNVMILAGTGPVGQTTAELMHNEGCYVCISSRNMQKAKEVSKRLGNKGITLSLLKYNPEMKSEASDYKLRDSDIIISTGQSGIQMINNDWMLYKKLKVIADTNATPPYGVGCIHDHNYSEKTVTPREIGELKNNTQKGLIRGMFERPQILHLNGIFDIAKNIELGRA